MIPAETLIETSRQAVCSADCLIDAPDAVQEPVCRVTMEDAFFPGEQDAEHPGTRAIGRSGWTRWAAGAAVTLGGFMAAQTSQHLGPWIGPLDSGISQVVQPQTRERDVIPANGARGHAPPAECLNAMRQLTIQYHGRLQPFEVFARDILAFASGHAQTGREDPVQTVLSMIAEADEWRERPLIAVAPSVRVLLGLQPGATTASWSEVMNSTEFLRRAQSIAHRKAHGRRLNPADRETVEVYERFVALNDLFEQELYLVPPPAPGRPHWLPILRPNGYDWMQQISMKKVWSEFLTAVSSRRSERIEAAGKQLVTLLQPRGF
jgi:hypothetical protein